MRDAGGTLGLSDLAFVSSNQNKYREAQTILESLGVSIEFLRHDLPEIQSDSLEIIASAKAREAFSEFARPVLVEDAGLFIDSLQGFPGPYSSYVLGTIGCRGIINLTGQDRTARFVSVVVYCDGDALKSFEGRICGTISESARGAGWGYDPVFIPDGSEQTFAEMDVKDEISHRHRSLEVFSRWYLNRRV